MPLLTAVLAATAAVVLLLSLPPAASGPGAAFGHVPTRDRGPGGISSEDFRP